MGETTAIEWTDKTHNFWYGCKKVSPGCKYCYAERDMTRFGRDFKTVTRAKGFTTPMKWKDPAKVFVNSLSDFFIEEADDWRADAWEVIKNTPHLDYQVLTKRPENIADRLPDDWGESGYPNVWLGVSVESQEYTDRIHVLNQIPAVIRFVSYEPALGPLDLLVEFELGMVDWVISGGESGYKPRPAETEWFRRIQFQCNLYRIPFFHKQNGGRKKINNSWGGRQLHGRTYSAFPKYYTDRRPLELV